MDKIILKKPDIDYLNKKGYICFDMHIHSEYSSDCNSKVISIIKRAKELGIGIAITDHNEIKGCLEAYKLNKNIIVPGVEVRSKEGFDLLFYFSKIKRVIDFYEKIVKPNKKKVGSSKLKGVDLIEKSEDYKAIACIAHTYRPSPRRIIHSIIHTKNVKSIFDKVKIFEVINSKNFRIFNNKAIKIAKKKDKGIIGGSDSHSIRTIGGCVMCIKKDKVHNILNEISSNNVIVVGKERSLVLDVISRFMRL